jgi:hypothetical protein
MKRIERSSDFGADRYKYDFLNCTYAKGWAQLDTSQDASYFGQWINPELLQIFSYCEGDTCLLSFDSAAELSAEVESIKQWNEEQGLRFLGIDPGFGETMKANLLAAGLGQYFH